MNIQDLGSSAKELVNKLPKEDAKTAFGGFLALLAFIKLLNILESLFLSSKSASS